jgi:hypothetical protein
MGKRDGFFVELGLGDFGELSNTLTLGGNIIHCKKGWRFSRPQPGCHLPNSGDRAMYI